jgi:hypothetical protein
MQSIFAEVNSQYSQNPTMNSTPNRLIALVFPGLTAIALIVTYGIWVMLDDILRSVYGPGLLVGIAFLIGLVIVSPGLYRRDRRSVYMGLIGLYVAALVIGWNIDWSSTKPFYRFYSGIRPGMTIAEVQQRLDQTFPANGSYPKPLTEGVQSDRSTMQYFRLEPPLSAEVVTVYFEQGRVTKAEYSPDNGTTLCDDTKLMDSR